MSSAAAPTRDLSTPDIPASSAVLSCYASTRIKAPASLVFRTLRNSETWKDWNQWIPRVVITYHPPDKDLATMAEIAELVRNTSIASAFDSEITDGAINGPVSRATPSDPNFVLPPVTRQRLASNASRLSSSSNRDAASRNQSVSSATNGAPSSPQLSGAAKFQASQASRKASVASGGTPEPVTNNVLVESPMNPNLLMPAPENTAATQSAVSAGKERNPMSAAQRKRIAINALYGEPSVRIRLGTKMTFHCRMKMPVSYAVDTTVHVVVTEVSRPDDVEDQNPFAAQQQQEEEEAAQGGEQGEIARPPSRPALARSKTHTLSRTGVYRIVWTMVNTYTSPTKLFPKFMLQAQRVHEIRPVVNGDGTEECVYEDWELQKGVLAKTVKKQYGDYLQTRFERWGQGLGEFCESMGGAVERRDFISGS